MNLNHFQIKLKSIPSISFHTNLLLDLVFGMSIVVKRIWMWLWLKLLDVAEHSEVGKLAEARDKTEGDIV